MFNNRIFIATAVVIALTFSLCGCNKPQDEVESESTPIVDINDNSSDLPSNGLSDTQIPADTEALSEDQSYVMVYNGTRIDTNDYRFILAVNGFANAEENQAAALNQLLEAKILTERAAAEGIFLTEEEKQEAVEWAESFKSMFAEFGMDLSFISTERMIEYYMVEFYFSHLMDKYMADLVITEEEINQAFADYKVNDKTDYYEMMFKYAFNESREALETAAAKVKAGDITFDQLVEELDEEYNPEYGVLVAEHRQLQYGMGEEDYKSILELEVGQMSEIFEVLDYFLIVEAEFKNIPADEDIIDVFREKHTDVTRTNGFWEILNTWKAEADYTINQPGIDAA